MKLTVLLVEDVVDDVFFMQRAFAKASVPVDLRIARDGREALRYLKGEAEFADRAAHPCPRIILLDLNIPYVHGLKVLEHIRDDTQLRRLVVIVLTSSADSSDIEEAYALGVNSFLVKPTGLEVLEEVVELVCQYWLSNNHSPLSR